MEPNDRRARILNKLLPDEWREPVPPGMMPNPQRPAWVPRGQTVGLPDAWREPFVPAPPPPVAYGPVAPVVPNWPPDIPVRVHRFWDEENTFDLAPRSVHERSNLLRSQFEDVQGQINEIYGHWPGPKKKYPDATNEDAMAQNERELQLRALKSRRDAILQQADQDLARWRQVALEHEESHDPYGYYLFRMKPEIEREEAEFEANNARARAEIAAANQQLMFETRN